jgi:hypothetical protein
MPQKAHNSRRATARPVTIDDDQLYSVLETAAARSDSRSGVYLDIKHGRLRAIKRGARTLIPGFEIRRRNREEAEALHALAVRRADAARELALQRIDAGLPVDTEQPVDAEHHAPAVDRQVRAVGRRVGGRKRANTR